MQTFFYLAPMEGITRYLYRNLQRTYFEPADGYVTPFITTNQHGVLKTRDRMDILPEHNQGTEVVPQILGNHAEDFLVFAKQLKEYGYRQINLNLGCPSRTVVTKKKGSGFLSEPQKLDVFLGQVCEGLEAQGMQLSIKTRLGVEEPEEIYPLMEIFNRHPLAEVMIHPRVQRDFYGNTPSWEVFARAAAMSVHPVCYNGDLFTVERIRKFREQFSHIERLMIGRGLLMDPGLLNRMKGETPKKEQYFAFLQALAAGYAREIPGERNVLFKLKEVWSYMIHLFEESETYGKKIRKAKSLSEYEAVVRQLFTDRDIQEPADQW